jgi:hypothetical protein
MLDVTSINNLLASTTPIVFIFLKVNTVGTT